MFPLIFYVTMLYRCVFAYYAARDSCYKAAKAQTWTLGCGGGGTGPTALQNDLLNIPGIVVVPTPSYKVVIQPLSGGSSTEQAGPLGSVNPGTNVYFIEETVNFTISPLLGNNPAGTWMGLAIPGMTVAFPLTIRTQFYAENPQGLVN
jgi:hypothetical protein